MIRNNPTAILLVHSESTQARPQVQLTILWRDKSLGDVQARSYWDKPGALAAEAGIPAERIFGPGSPEESSPELAQALVRSLADPNAAPMPTRALQVDRKRPAYHSWRKEIPGDLKIEKCRHCGFKRKLSEDHSGCYYWMDGGWRFQSWSEPIPFTCPRK